MSILSITAIQYEQKRNLIRKNYSEIYNHELAHKKAAGSFAGGIVIEKNSQGIPVGGHVSIQMPILDKQNPQKTIQHADVVIKSALAPATPSEQDYRVANQAKLIKAKAEKYISKNKLDYYA